MSDHLCSSLIGSAEQPLSEAFFSLRIHSPFFFTGILLTILETSNTEQVRSRTVEMEKEIEKRDGAFAAPKYLP